MSNPTDEPKVEDEGTPKAESGEEISPEDLEKAAGGILIGMTPLPLQKMDPVPVIAPGVLPPKPGGNVL
jgi:hypothetical protein